MGHNKKLRFFMFSAAYNTAEGFTFTNFGTSRPYFPSNEQLQKQVMEKDKDAERIVIMSICELSEEDYKVFWGEQVLSNITNLKD